VEREERTKMITKMEYAGRAVECNGGSRMSKYAQSRKAFDVDVVCSDSKAEAEAEK
jgi:hypothetical protein